MPKDTDPMSGLDFIEQLGMGDPSGDVTETLQTNEPKSEDVKTQDVSLDSANTEAEKNESAQGNTEPSEYDKLKSLYEESLKEKEIMQKRINDKDDYINEMREASRAEELSRQKDITANVDSDLGDEETFWDDPEKYISKMKQDFQEQIRMQQVYNQEIVFANTKDDYWKTVDPDGDGSYRPVREALQADKDFASKMDSNKNSAFSIAYNYLSERNAAKAKADAELKEKHIREYLEENGKVYNRKETVPSTTNLGGKSGDTRREADSDGFMSVFG